MERGKGIVGQNADNSIGIKEELAIMERVNAVRKEDETYKNIVGWIIADSVRNVYKGIFKIDGFSYEVDYKGKEPSGGKSHRITHKKLWNDLQSEYGEDKDYKYYPRFRLSIWDGVAYIFIHSAMNVHYVINRILKEGGASKLEVEIELNDLEQGEHYDFKIK